MLGANDGIISTACLVLGVAAAEASKSAIMTAGVAALVAGAASMALGEYVSVSSQRDVEQADLAISIKTAPEPIRRAFFGAMSKRAAESLKEEIEILGPTRSKDVEAAQERIIAQVMQLSESGEIDISPEDSSESGG